MRDEAVVPSGGMIVCEACGQLRLGIAAVDEEGNPICAACLADYRTHLATTDERTGGDE